MSLLIDNVTIFSNDDRNRVLHGQAVAVEGARIVAVGERERMRARYSNLTPLDGEGRLLLPGFTNAHMHFYGMYARGISLKQSAANFHEVLQYLWWALDKALDDEAVYYSALIPAISSVRHGVTSIIDHHASPNAVAGSLDQIERALSEVGVRALLCYEVSDRDGATVRDRGLAENERYMRKCRERRRVDPDHLFDGMMGLHASFTVDDGTLERAAAIAAELDRGCHIHMLEDYVDETLTREKYGRSVVERLHHYGVLSRNSIAAHGIFLDDHGRELLADRDTIVVHQAQSNMNNAVGRADIFALLGDGLTVGLGTDGMTGDMRRETMTGYLMHKHHMQDNNLGWGEFEKMLLKNNAAIYERLTGQKVGRIEADYLADIILVDYYPPTAFSGDNFWGHFLFGIVDADVNTTIVNGRIIMHNKQIPHLDEAAIAARSRPVGDRVWQRYNQ